LKDGRSQCARKAEACRSRPSARPAPRQADNCDPMITAASSHHAAIQTPPNMIQSRLSSTVVVGMGFPDPILTVAPACLSPHSKRIAGWASCAMIPLVSSLLPWCSLSRAPLWRRKCPRCLTRHWSWGSSCSVASAYRTTEPPDHILFKTEQPHHMLIEPATYPCNLVVGAVPSHVPRQQWRYVKRG
jgi:hypothetical protein